MGTINASNYWSLRPPFPQDPHTFHGVNAVVTNGTGLYAAGYFFFPNPNLRSIGWFPMFENSSTDAWVPLGQGLDGEVSIISSNAVCVEAFPCFRICYQIYVC